MNVPSLTFVSMASASTSEGSLDVNVASVMNLTAVEATAQVRAAKAPAGSNESLLMADVLRK